MRSGVALTSLELCTFMKNWREKALSSPWRILMLCHLFTHHSGWETFNASHWNLVCFHLFYVILSCVSFQGVPEVDPGTHKYKASSQPQAVSQTAPQPEPATHNFNPTQIPTVSGSITANPEQVTISSTLMTFRYWLNVDWISFNHHSFEMLLK